MNVEEDLSMKVGRMLATSDPGEEVVITGVAARLPECDNVEQFCENLKNNVFMVSNDDRRWKRTDEETPYSTGKVNSLDKFDAGFFGVSYHQANYMDPQCRKLLEVAVEAVLDSGYSLTEIQKMKTGVFVAATMSDSEKILLYDKMESPHFGVDGCSHSMLAHQISYHLGLNGPSTNLDSACSSGLYCFEQAYRDIKMGRYDNAIVAGSQILLNPILNRVFYKLGIASLKGDTTVFAGNGYIRSEAIVVLLLQRAENARRVYAEVVHTKVNVDGFKTEGISFLSQHMVGQLFKETFSECNKEPESLIALEAHATGTKTGDPQELHTICKTMCQSRKTPLLISSVKSSIGHSEPVAGLCSILKMILGMNNDVIYPNYDNKELHKKNLKVISETTHWPEQSSDLVGVNSFGFGGANAFLILKRWLKKKRTLEDNLPRLVCFSARNEECLQPILDDLVSRSLDVEYVRLWHAIHRYGVKKHKARGFVVLSKNGVVTKSSGSFETTPLCFLFDGVNANWRGVVQELSAVVLFRKNVERILKIVGIECVESDLIGNVVMYCALVDTLRNVGVVHDFVLGRSLGVLVAAYAERVLSLPEIVLCAQQIDAVLVVQQKLVDGLKQIIPFSKNDGLLADYIVDCLLGSGVYGQTLNNAAVVAFGPSKVSASINILPETSCDVINSFLTGLGRIYEMGHNLKLDKLYPNVPFPVSRGTPSISPLIQWIHTDDWFLYRHGVTPSNSVQTFDFFLKGHDSDWIFLSGHVLDGRCITPMSAFIYMVWDTFSKMTGVMKSKMSVTFENLRMHKIVDILQETDKKFVVRILKHSQRFEINETHEVIFSGTIAFGDNNLVPFSYKEVDPLWVLTEDDVYKQLQLRGYHYQKLFRCVKEYDVSTQQGVVAWNNNWTTFIDGLMQLNLLHCRGNDLELPTQIGQLQIDAQSFLQSGIDSKRVFLQNNRVGCNEIAVTNIATKTLKRQNVSSTTVLQSYKFVPYFAQLPLLEALQVDLQIVLENVNSTTLKIIEVVEELTPLMEKFPLVQKKILILPEDACLPTNAAAHLLIMSNVLSRNLLNKALKAVCKQGFVLTREASKLEAPEVVSSYDCGTQHLILLRQSVATPTKVIRIKSDDFKWIPDLQQSLKLNETPLLLAENDPNSGVLGFVNCLKLEHNFKYVFWQDNSGKFNLNDQQLKKNLFANVFRDGVWGSYKSLVLDLQKPSRKVSATEDESAVQPDSIKTVPEAYDSALYLLTVAANLHPGDNILLHCLPATTTKAIVNIAERHNCHVFITDQNRVFGNQNTVSFQIVISASTNRDLHLVSNCLAPGGVFLQLGDQQPLEICNRCRYTVVDITSALNQRLGFDTKTKEPKFYCNSEDVYVVIGGLGGVGLEFIEWLIERGARKLTICARSRHLTVYQKLKIHRWKTHEVEVFISNNDVTTEQGTTKLLQQANSFGNVKAIFNLAAATKDEVFKHQTIETFSVPFPSKALAVKHLDKVSKSLCPNLEYFVVFSSFGSSIGNVGQTNYNMANSVMERVCEKRKADGYPALAIQWGPLADVGLVTKMKGYNANRTLNGVMQQSLKSAFEVMDRLLTQDETVVSCVVLPSVTLVATDDYEQAIKNIIGITNLNAISHYATLPELGMDSLTSVEIQSYLKENYGLFLDMSKIVTLTFAKLKNLIASTV